jgi:hypothetical protein
MSVLFQDMHGSHVVGEWGEETFTLLPRYSNEGVLWTFNFSQW